MLPVIKGAAYCLFHGPDLVMVSGTTYRTERIQNPNSDYIKAVPSRLRKFQDVVGYLPNQVYIGNIWPEDMPKYTRPWYENLIPDAKPQGPFGELVPQNLLYGVLKLADSFDLVVLEKDFQERIKPEMVATGLFQEQDFAKWKEGASLEAIQKEIETAHAEPLNLDGQLVGCVRRAHELDPALQAEVMLENLLAKATAVWTVRRFLKNTGFDPKEIEYIIETTEEACGDMNQRGGGNFAKSIGELCGLVNATGSDIRSFCAGPAHGMMAAAALVQTGVFKNVLVVGGGSGPKLGMNSRDHVKKGMPILEDMLGTFAIVIGENDGVNPVIRTEFIGRHKIGTGATPQAVMEALVAEPLARAGLKFGDVDRYAPELQNPEITEPAGAGNVPLANHKMIAALAVMKGQVPKAEMEAFVQAHGVPGYAPTQGHIPSGVPFVGYAREGILNGKYKRVMIIGKGSLFLGRLTNLFDGISFIIEPNIKETKPEGIDEEAIRSLVANTLRKVAEELKG